MKFLTSTNWFMFVCIWVCRGCCGWNFCVHIAGTMLRYGTAWVGAFLCPVLFSGCVELLQEYCTTYRGGDWLDFAANTTGAILASLIAYYVVRPRMMNKQ